jgi:Uma2 family endonuclease
VITLTREAAVSTQPKTFLTPEQYLEIERKAEYKSEYYRGEMFAMAGASREHNLLVAHLLRDLGNQLRMKSCEVYPSDMRVRVSSTGLYAYPDVVAVCGEPQLLDNQLDTLLNPHLIVEVLSSSTEAYDRGRKFEHYQTIESLSEYLLLASDRVHADLYTRQPDGCWLLTSAKRLEDSLDLKSVGCSLALAGLYEKVDFAEAGSTATEPRP